MKNLTATSELILFSCDGQEIAKVTDSDLYDDRRLFDAEVRRYADKGAYLEADGEKVEDIPGLEISEDFYLDSQWEYLVDLYTSDLDDDDKDILFEAMQDIEPESLEDDFFGFFATQDELNEQLLELRDVRTTLGDTLMAYFNIRSFVNDCLSDYLVYKNSKGIYVWNC